MDEAAVRKIVAGELRRAELTARITDADIERLAQHLLDRLEERLFPALAEPAPDTRPRVRKGGRAKRYFRSD